MPAWCLAPTLRNSWPNPHRANMAPPLLDEPQPPTHRLPRLFCLEAAFRPIQLDLGKWIYNNPLARFDPQTQIQIRIRIQAIPFPTIYSPRSMAPLAQLQAALLSDPRPTELPRHSTPSIRVSKRKRQCHMSQDEDQHPPATSQLQAALNPSFSTTTTTLNSPVTSRVIRGRPRGIHGGLNRISVSLVQRGLDEKSAPTQFAPDGYSAGHNVSPQQRASVDSMEGPHAKRRRVDYGQSPIEFGAKETNASMLQLPYGHSPTDDAPSHSAHTYAHTYASAYISTQSPTYACPVHISPLQRTSGSNIQVPEHSYHSSRPTTCVQPVQMLANDQPLTTHAARTHQPHTPAGLPCIGSGLNLQSTPPVSPGRVPLRHIPISADTPLLTESVPSPVGPRIITGGPSPLSTVSPWVLAEPAVLFPGDDPIGWPSGLSATEDDLNLSLLDYLITWGDVVCTAHSHPEGSHASGEGTSFNSYHSEQPISIPHYDQSLSSMSHPGGPVFPSVPLWLTPSFVEEPPSHLPRPLVDDNLTVSCQSTNSGGGPNGSDININAVTAHKNGKPESSNQETGPNRSGRTHKRRESKPYQRPTPYDTRKTRPVKHEDDLQRLEQRCMKQGADEGAIGLLSKVFANEVSQEALTRSLTDAEVETNEFGIVTGKIYTAFLEPTDEGEGATPRYICRLCHSEQTWKHAKDVVRHLKRDHLGLADTCKKWYAFGHCRH